jgi:flagellar M-ring protein FliF
MDQFRGLLGQLSIAQRLWIIFGALGATALLVVVVMIAGTPQYEPAFTKLNPATAGTIADALRKGAIPFQIADAGTTVLVPSSRLADAKVAAESAGVTADSVGGNELLDKLGFGASEFQQQSAAQRALEGELTRAIQGLAGVASAKVLITPAQKGVFADQDQAATASIVLTMASGKVADATLVAAVVSTAIGAVAGLTADSVTVVDSSGRVLAGGTDVAGTGSDLVRAKVERDLETKVTDLLNRAVGTGAAAVSVTADMDFDKVERQITTYTPVSESNYTPAGVSTTTEIYGAGAASGAGGIPGSGSNVPGLPTYPITLPSASPAASATASSSPAPSYVKTTQTVNYNLSQTVDRVSQEPGIVKRLSVAVLVDSKASTAIPADQLSSLVAAAVGADTKRGDVVTVSSVQFAAGSDSATTGAGAGAGGDMVAVILDYVRSGVGVLVALILLLITWRTMGSLRRRAEDAAFAALPGGHSLALSAPPPVGELGSGSQGALGMALGRVGNSEASEESEARTQIQGRLRQVADERPEALVGLMNSWMVHEGRR